MKNYNRAISSWLFICCLMVVLMVAVGGITRLTESGLSMTDWKPVMGTLPPLNEQEWQVEFSSYKQSPEYIKINSGMSLDEFKAIFWWEFIHRLLGRLTGFIFFVPLLYFAISRQITKNTGYKLLGIFILGGLQGFLGWFMVSSGLVDRPSVSHYRLAIHLSMAFILFAMMFRLALRLSGRLVASLWLPSLILLQVILGAFVAGLDAGFIYNDFPLMNGEIFPSEEIMSLDNQAFVQFIHRWFAFIVLAAIIYNYLIKRDKLSVILLTLVILQVILGIVTLMMVNPIVLASLHQLLAMVVFAVSLLKAKQTR